MEKNCFKCGKTLPLTEFYKHPKMPDGHVNKCIKCNKADVRGNYLENKLKDGFIEKERKRGRQKYHSLYKGTLKENNKRNDIYKQKYPEKYLSKIKCGNLKKPFEGAEKHHWSYNIEHAKDVIWLSKKDHMKSHRFIVYDQERFMYRRFDSNILLDTKESHLEFINYCILNYED
jgi:hypothetical protein